MTRNTLHRIALLATVMVAVLISVLIAELVLRIAVPPWAFLDERTDDYWTARLRNSKSPSPLADQLDVRAAARTAYATLVAGGAGWLPPLFVRGPMSDWNFALATTRMTDALALLARRDEIVALAGRLGVTVPADLRTAYESARDTLDDANRVADAETAALRALDTAIGAVAAPRAPLVTLGLLGTAPEATLADARAAFSAGRPEAAAQAIAVTALIDSAVEVGRGRLVAAIVGLVAVIVLLIVAIVLVRRRRRRHPALVARPAEDMAHPMPSTGPDAAPPYATLADQSLGPLDGDPVAGPTDMIETPEPTDDAEPILEPETEPAPAETEPPPADRGDAP